MASSNYDELTLSCEAIDWDLWLQNDHAPSFEENYSHPDFDSPIWYTGNNKPPGSPRPNGGSQDVLTTEILDSDMISPNIWPVENYWPNFDSQGIPLQASTALDTSKKNPSAEINPSSTTTYPSASQLIPVSTTQNAPSPAASENLSCDWPSCTRTLPTRSAYNQHYKNHKRPFRCSTCGALRATKCHLVRHINERHHAAEKFYCPVPGCRREKYFPRKDNLKRHMRQVHCLVGAKWDV